MARSRIRAGTFLTLYCVALLLLFDFAYSYLVHRSDPSPRIQVPQYSHGLVPNFAGFDNWGKRRYGFYTNSLGFRDAGVRDVAAKAGTRRILLIGDSFTEGVGAPFEESFAGLLYRAGQQRADKIEFLNAGVLSYSPTIFYRKVKFLLEQKLTFDEVVVFSDISDVHDEATAYFCLDGHFAGKMGCPAAGDVPTETTARRRPWRLSTSFVVTSRMIGLIRYEINTLSGWNREFQFHRYRRAGWTIPGFDTGDYFAPLGIEGGIERSFRNMQALADLLAERRTPLSIVVYPWPMQLANEDRHSRQVALWHEFCKTNCRQFVDAFPAFFAVKDSRRDWYTHLYLDGDVHFSAEGNRLLADVVAKQLF